MPQSLDQNIHQRFQLKGGAYTDVSELIRLRYAAKQIDPILQNKSSNPLSGLLTSNFRGRGIDFAEVRTYEPGDDVRTIDWRVTARTQVPHTKLFQEEKERPVLLLVDQSHAMFFGSKVAFKSVVAAQLAALLAWISLEGGDRVGGIVFNDEHHREIRPKRSKHSVLRLLSEINDFNHNLTKAPFESPGNYLTNALLNVRRVAKHGSTVFILSDFSQFDEDARLHLRQISRHNDVVGICISDPLESDLPQPDIYTVTNGNQRVEINTAIKSNRVQYHHDFENHIEQIRTQFSKLKSPLFEFSTADELIPRLAKTTDEFHRVDR